MNWNGVWLRGNTLATNEQGPRSGPQHLRRRMKGKREGIKKAGSGEGKEGRHKNYSHFKPYGGPFWPRSYPSLSHGVPVCFLMSPCLLPIVFQSLTVLFWSLVTPPAQWFRPHIWHLQSPEVQSLNKSSLHSMHSVCAPPGSLAASLQSSSHVVPVPGPLWFPCLKHWCMYTAGLWAGVLPWVRWPLGCAFSCLWHPMIECWKLPLPRKLLRADRTLPFPLCRSTSGHGS